MGAYDLLTLEEAKEHLGIGNAEQDSYLATLIERVSDWIDGVTNRQLFERTYTDEEYDGGGTPEIMLREWPVTSVTAIDFRQSLGAWETQSLTYLSVLPDTRTISLLDNCFPIGRRNVRVTYVAGYDAASIPDRLKQLALEVLTHKHKLKDRQMQSVAAVTFQGQTVSYREGLPRETIDLLGEFRRRTF